MFQRIDGDYWTGKNYFSTTKHPTQNSTNSNPKSKNFQIILGPVYSSEIYEIDQRPTLVSKAPCELRPMSLTYLDTEKTVPMLVGIDDYCNLVSLVPDFRSESSTAGNGNWVEQGLVYGPYFIPKLFQKGTAAKFTLKEVIEEHD